MPTTDDFRASNVPWVPDENQLAQFRQDLDDALRSDINPLDDQE